MKYYRWGLFCTVSALCLAGASTHAASAAKDELALEEITVTAEKRETNIQTTSASISVVSGDSLLKQQISGIEGLSQSLPNVNFGQTTGNARIAIRGIGFDNISLGNEGRIAFHTDGVYVSRPAAALANFYDIERIEVLRGPQGTLYGRNATGGAINVISRAPTQDLGGYVQGTAGNYDTYKLEGAVGAGLTSTLAARVSFQVVERDGYGKNLTNGLDVDDQSTRAVRTQFALDPNDWLNVTVSGDYFTEDDHAYAFHYLGVGSLPNPTSTPPLPGITPKGLLVGGTVPANRRDSTADTGPFNNREFWGLSGHATMHLGEMDLHLISAYRESDFHTLTDLDATSARITVYDQLENARQFSQEIRLDGKFSRGDWIIGGYYFDESLFGGTRVALDPVVLTAAPTATTLLRQGFYGMGDLNTKAYAAFASVRYELIPDLAIKVGGRYSDEKKSVDEELKLDFVTPYPPFVPFFPPTPPGARRQASQSWSSFTPSATLEYQANADLFLYASFSRGFKSGGFNLGNLQPPFAQEKLSAYEIGLRSEWLDSRLRANVTGFYYEYTNLQVSKVNGATITIENASNASVYGMEAEVTALLGSHMRVEGSVAVLDSKYQNYVSPDPARAALGPLNLSGNELTQAPNYTVNLDAAYDIPTDFGVFTLRGQARWVGQVFFTQYNLPHTAQKAYGLYNGFVEWEKDNWTATAYVRNIGNTEIISSGLVSSATLTGAPFVGTFEPPRTYGLTIGYRF